MRFERILCCVFSFIFLFGCATYEVPLKTVSPIPLSEKQPYRIELEIASELSSRSFQSSWFGSTWNYQIGRAVSESIMKTMSENFASVCFSGAAGCKGDFVITPVIENFDAKVPMTVFSRTDTKLVLIYKVYDLTSKRHFTLSSSEMRPVSEVEFASYKRRVNSEIKFNVVMAPGAVVSAPKCEYLAAEDAAVEILSRIDYLNKKLVEVISSP